MPEADEATLEEEPKQLAIEIEDDAPAQAEATAPEQEPEPQVEVKKDTDDLEEYGDNVKRRIGKMTAKLRESERREKAATEYAQAVNLELEEMRKKTANLDRSFVNEFDIRVQSEEALLKQELKKAIDTGDSEKQAEVQVRLSQVAADKDKVTRVKRQQEVTPQPQQFQQPQVNPLQKPQTVQQQPQQQLDPKAKAWAEEREWFGNDRPMTLLALAEHESMLTEGYDPDGDSDTYYAELNKRVEEAFPHKFQKDKKRKAPKVAAASRARVNKNGKKEIVLTESEATMADRLNVPREAYAKQVEKLRTRSE